MSQRQGGRAFRYSWIASRDWDERPAEHAKENHVSVKYGVRVTSSNQLDTRVCRHIDLAQVSRSLRGEWGRQEIHEKLIVGSDVRFGRFVGRLGDV
jgi:hypothetical protein